MRSLFRFLPLILLPALPRHAAAQTRLVPSPSDQIGDYHSQTPVLSEDYRQRAPALWRNPDLSGWGLSLASAYQDFAPNRQICADFTPTSPAYGAFTITNPALAPPPRR
jgi:hypothetical protein